ncbi:MAG: hypothetical protein QOH58_1666 [Thermoleophilaceae bacterium]|nr:hypothetical protein [Thermoleophilaceae bacterium]
MAQEVNDFLRDGDYVSGIEHGYSTTYLLLDPDEQPGEVLGYLTVSIDSIRLSGAEKRALGKPHFADFGAVRIVMIGVDHRFTAQGYGELLVLAAIDFTHQIGDFVALRFVVADANIRKQEWYEHRGFVVNRSPNENDPEDADRETISMRFDVRD